MKSFEELKQQYARKMGHTAHKNRIFKTPWDALEREISINPISAHYEQVAILYAEQFFNRKKLTVNDELKETFEELLKEIGDIKV